MAAARKRRGLTQVQLAEMMGVTQSRIDYYERRAKSPPVDFVANIAAALAVSINHLIADEEQKPERLHPGPASALEQKIEALRKLSKKEQEVVLRMLEGLISTSERTAKGSLEQAASETDHAE